MGIPLIVLGGGKRGYVGDVGWDLGERRCNWGQRGGGWGKNRRKKGEGKGREEMDFFEGIQRVQVGCGEREFLGGEEEEKEVSLRQNGGSGWAGAGSEGSKWRLPNGKVFGIVPMAHGAALVCWSQATMEFHFPGDHTAYTVLRT